jgi:hypothetical protein
LNFPLLGLYEVVVDSRCPSDEKLHALKAHLLEHPYARLTREFGDGHLVVVMLIPVSRLEEFRTWIDRLCRRLEVPRVSIHLVTEFVSACCFDSYEAKRGWTDDFWSVLFQMQSIIKGETEASAPFLHSFKYSYEEVRTGTVVPIRLQPEDFACFERLDRPIAVTSKASSSIEEEARQLGLSLAAARRYRSRVQWLDAHRARSPPLHFGLLHVGLDAELSIRLRSEPQVVRRVVQACQLLPSLTGILFEEAGALLILFLPNAPAVDIHSLLRSTFAACDIDASLALESAWRAFGTHISLLSPENYDFDSGTWRWSEPAV